MDDDDAGGLCLCQQDSYLRTVATVVVSCTPLEAPLPPASVPNAAASSGKAGTAAGKTRNGGGGGGKVPGGGGDGGGDKVRRGAAATAASPADGPVAAGTVAAVPPLPPPSDSPCRYGVVLRETPMFPESGGQPCDLGVLRLRHGDGSTEAVPVHAVAWKEGVLVHVTEAPVPPGSQVEAVVDWARRFDHMQQHTGQHVLSAVAWRLLGADTVSWELHPLAEETHGSGDYCCVAVDLSVPQIGAEQLSELEAAANAELRALRVVAPLLLDPADPRDAEALTALAGSREFRGRLPPADKVKGRKLRLVHIQGLDVNACGGTHVRCAGEVQVVKLVGCERTRGTTRLRFLAGGRALGALAGCLAREAGLTARLTAPPARHGEMVDMLLRDRREAAKARKLLSAELAERIGRELAAQAAAAAAASGADCADGDETPAAAAAAAAAAPPQAATRVGRRWAVLHRPASDLDFLCAVAAAALETAPAAAAAAPVPPPAQGGLELLLLTADGSELGAAATAPPKPGVEDSVEVTFLVAGRAPELVKAAGGAVAEALGGRGGGRPGRFQGKATGVHRLPAAVRAFMGMLPPGWLGTAGA